ncbi:MAG: nucleotidyltransferase domain-containing protein [candidate division WOR-3 bacterium]|nr:nucleotidyltransferase domain-containing protein [candidate division WOR-3 bacterium]
MAVDVQLAPNEQAALDRLKEVLTRDFGLVKLILYGSKACGDSDRESDVNVVVVLRDEFDWRTKRAIYDVCFNIGLEHDVILQPTVYSHARYNSPLIGATSLYQKVQREGIAV